MMNLIRNVVMQKLIAVFWLITQQVWHNCLCLDITIEEEANTDNNPYRQSFLPDQCPQMVALYISLSRSLQGLLVKCTLFSLVPQGLQKKTLAGVSTSAPPVGCGLTGSLLFAEHTIVIFLITSDTSKLIPAQAQHKDWWERAHPEMSDLLTTS